MSFTKVHCMARSSHSLDPLFKPSSVAVIGASATPGSVGNILLRNLLVNPFGGIVYPVNTKRHSVNGVRCYPSLADVPETVDLAVIATPAATVPETIRQCVDRGVKAAIVISAGFSATGDLRHHTYDADALGPYRLGGFFENPGPGPLNGRRRFNSSAG